MAWGYRNETHGIPTTRITTVVEEHWRVLKTRFLSLHNRPRLDYVAHILNTQVIPEYIQDYAFYMHGLKQADWWRHFTKNWKFLSVAKHNNIYYTYFAQWWCTCPGFSVHTYHLCKPLSHSRPFGPYRNIARSRFPPFFKFEHQDGRLYALLEINEPMWNTCQSVPFVPNGNEIFDDGEVHEEPLLAADEMRCILEWMVHHISELKQTASAGRQLDYIGNELFPKIAKYKNEMERQTYMFDNFYMAAKRWCLLGSLTNIIIVSAQSSSLSVDCYSK